MVIPVVFHKILRWFCRKYDTPFTRRLIREHLRFCCSKEPLFTWTRDSLGMYSFAGDYIGYEIYFFGTYNRNASEFIRSNVTEGYCVVDVGAGIGWFTLLMAIIVGDKGVVWAIEPFRKNIEVMKRSIKRNGFENRIRLIDKAAWDYSGEIFFEPDIYSSVVCNRIEKSFGWGKVRYNGGEKVQTCRLSDVVTDRVNFIKIDTEGSEVHVIKEIEELIKSVILSKKVK